MSKNIINVISVDNMRLSDELTIRNGIPSLTLMKNAAIGILKAVEWKGKIHIITGSGNNGGDGFALACELNKLSIPCEIFSLSEKVSSDSEHYRTEAINRKIQISLLSEFKQELFKDAGIIVDCIFGTGFHGEVRGLVLDVITAINKSNAFVVSADINSGMNGDTGRADVAVKSNITVSIGQLKNGFFIGDAHKYIGSLVNADIGINPSKPENYLLSESEFVKKHMEISANYELANLSEIPNGITTLEELKKHFPKNDSAIFIQNEILSIIATPSEVWILKPDYYFLF